ncbi:uncharacterized protein LOC122254375 [Penaeus japonicus]|uniref:uncharacterized protein LOC122254375 n=1 Tax=Penaeus japonicus TaxID=27405 RepID=UPI001C70F8AE|nr:uncharacterized protein LOC122254375 [Penaeus japonicus]
MTYTQNYKKATKLLNILVFAYEEEERTTASHPWFLYLTGFLIDNLMSEGGWVICGEIVSRTAGRGGSSSWILIFSSGLKIRVGQSLVAMIGECQRAGDTLLLIARRRAIGWPWSTVSPCTLLPPGNATTCLPSTVTDIRTRHLATLTHPGRGRNHTSRRQKSPTSVTGPEENTSAGQNPFLERSQLLCQRIQLRRRPRNRRLHPTKAGRSHADALIAPGVAQGVTLCIVTLVRKAMTHLHPYNSATTSTLRSNISCTCSYRSPRLNTWGIK